MTRVLPIMKPYPNHKLSLENICNKSTDCLIHNGEAMLDYNTELKGTKYNSSIIRIFLIV